MVEQTDDRTRALVEEVAPPPPPDADRKVMVCPVCGFDNLQGDDQCANCGADLRTSDIPTAVTSFERMLTEVPLSAIDAPNCLTVDPGATISDVLRQMRDGHEAAVLITEGGRVVGIFTERDALMKLAGQPSTDGVIRDVMTTDPVVLRASDSLAVAIQKMAVGGFRHIPLVDDGRPIGIVTSTDVFRHVLQVVG
jgi:CBS domain-containing protein